MTLSRLLWRSLRFHWRGNLAVMLGVAVGAAVLTGALLVGDSLQGSLRDLTERQLGGVAQVLVSSRFFREQLARELSQGPSDPGHVVPVIVLQGAASVPPSGESSTPRRVGRVTIWGVPDSFWTGGTPLAPPPDQAVLSEALARALDVKPGDTVTLHLQKTSSIPRESLLGKREADDVLETLKLTVQNVMPESHDLGRFSLSPGPQAPLNVFVPLGTLQAKLGQPGRVNTLLIEGAGEALDENLKKLLTLDDWGLRIRTPDSRTRDLFARWDKSGDRLLPRAEWQGRLAESMVHQADKNDDKVLSFDEVLEYYRTNHPYLSLESRQLLVEPAAADAALKAARETGLRAAPTLVYLANRISGADQELPYSVVAALDPALPPPLGPFLPPGVEQLKDDEIVLVDWKDSPLKLKPGDAVRVSYFAPDETSQPKEITETFRFRGYVPLEGAANDPDLTPEFPGITDQRSVGEWEPPSSFDRRDIQKRVKKRDEDYWKEYRTTPKAYVTLKTGQRLWGSRFGNLTSIRLASGGRQPPVKVAEHFARSLLSHLQPEQGGFVIDPVRQRSLQASGGGIDFGQLFLGFSFFLIAAALLLVGLLVRLNLERRAGEIGLLLAVGYRLRTVRRLLLMEGSLLSALGSLAGLAFALVYAWLLLDFLASWWPGGLDRSFLRLHVSGRSLLIGWFASVLVSVLTIAWAVRSLGRVPPRALLAGDTSGESEVQPPRPIRWSRWVAVGSAIVGLALLAGGGFIRDHELQAFTFFSGGALLLTAGLAAVWIALHVSPTRQQGLTLSVARLSARNAARQPSRSLLTAGLLASAAFLVVAVESFRRQPDRNFLDRHSGSGGFVLLGESDLPIFQDLNTTKGREQLDFPDEADEVLKDVSFFALRLRPGDDASCLNLYQPNKPKLLGVPAALVERGGFHFATSEAQTPNEKANLWLLLDQPRDDGAIPVFGEKNTVEWMLHQGLGGELEVKNEKGEPVRLRIAGLLKDSVFQSGLLMSETSFLKLYPGQEGYHFFLIDAPPARAAAVEQFLERDKVLGKRGFEATPSAERLALYLAVENTYLSTFQLLGGLGLVLGAFGLAVVLLRTVWERRSELALMRALGFRHRALGWLLLAENGFLLLLGLGAGTLAALLAVLPHVLAGEGQVPWLKVSALLLGVLAVGLLAGGLAVRATLRTPLVPALRRE